MLFHLHLKEQGKVVLLFLVAASFLVLLPFHEAMATTAFDDERQSSLGLCEQFQQPSQQRHDDGDVDLPEDLQLDVRLELHIVQRRCYVI